MGLLADEALVHIDGLGSNMNDLFLAAIVFRVQSETALKFLPVFIADPVLRVLSSFVAPAPLDDIAT